MTDHLKTWAQRPGVQLWVIYLVLVMLGALAMLPVGYFVINYHIGVEKKEHEASVQRMMNINQGLIYLLDERLPEVVWRADAAIQAAEFATERAEGAAEVARGAVEGAKKAIEEAKGASSTARNAANVAKDAASEVKDAVTPRPAPEPKDAPAWLGGS